jgi:hypothetical protein
MEQESFFENPPSWWEEHWQDMPAFNQGKKEPFACINVRLETQKDLQRFSDLIDQKLTQKTKSIWFPFRSHWGADHNKKVWVDDEG